LVIVLGIDGMDPQFVEQYLGELPNLRALIQRGEFKRLQTTFPPQSPVAWSTFSTGLDPSRHGLFDFVYRDPRTMTPFSAMGETEEPSHTLKAGPYELPLGSPHVKLLRKGEVFWKLLGDAGVPVKILRMPVNYPPEKSKGDSLSGMGVPDMRGTFGTFTFFTDDPAASRHAVSGGEIVPVRIENDHAQLAIEGPPNPFLRGKTPVSIVLTVDVDPFESVGRFRIADRTFILRGGEWSEWIPVRFPILPPVKYAHGMVRVYAKSFRPEFQVYVSPVNFDPEAPAADISAPAGYSSQIAKKIGLFYTQGMPEDASAYREGVFDREEYLIQARSVADEQMRILKQGLAEFREGFLFLHFSGVDQNSHMLWKKFDSELLQTYKLADTTVAWVMRNDADATIIVMSDHGFASFDRAVNLNAWLVQQGFLHERKNMIGQDDHTLFPSADWAKTSAYALGLNAIYLNLAGRERNGSVPRTDAAQTLRILGDRLLALRDPESGMQVVARVFSPHPGFQGDIQYIPDLIVGFTRGYRSSWEGSLGGVSGPVLADNNDAWIGDHCMAPEFVPGVLISNRKSRVAEPRLKDLPASILSLYGIRRPDAMDGAAIF
jgi:predicted AlkP superfamily phosphohydrolase/phosphomutase